MQARASQLRVAIDLTAVETADFRVRFVEGLTRHATGAEFILLTSARTPAIDAAIPRVVVPEPTPLETLLTRVDSRLPGQSRRARLGRKVALPKSMRRVQAHWSLLSKLKVDVVFCPFTPSRVRDGVTPLVAAVYDLQHETSPHLLRSRQRARRAREFATIARQASHIVCASDEVKDAVCADADVVAKRVLTLMPGRLLVQINSADTREPDAYLLMPGDAEPRNNYPLVLTAFAQFRARNPQSPLKLVCAGTSRPRLVSAVTSMGLEDYVRFSGEEVTDLMRSCQAVLVPSLYETIGEHLLQAMALGRAVICSRLPSLLAIAGDAALTFDPHRAADLVGAFERIDAMPRPTDGLAARSGARFSELEDPTTVADAYVNMFREAKQCLAASR